MISYHFAGKDDLLEQVVRSVYEEGAQYMIPRIEGEHGASEAAVKPLQEILQHGQDEGVFAQFDTRTMAWSIRTLIDGVHRRRMIDPAFDFDTGINEMVALVERATRKVVP